MPIDFERVNRNLRSGAITSSIVFGVVYGAFIAMIMPGLLTGRWRDNTVFAVAGLLFIAWTASINIRSIRNAFGMRFHSDGVTFRKRGKEIGLRWKDVTRLRIDSYVIAVQLESGREVAISLSHARRPDEVREAICAAVPINALQGPQATR